jgi:hypothetical protein
VSLNTGQQTHARLVQITGRSQLGAGERSQIGISVVPPRGRVLPGDDRSSFGLHLEE